MKMTMLKTAAYDNWKPTSHKANGLKHNMIKAQAESVLNIPERLFIISPNSKQLNITADLNIDGAAPATRLNIHNTPSITIGRTHFTHLLFLKTLNIHTMQA